MNTLPPYQLSAVQQALFGCAFFGQGRVRARVRTTDAGDAGQSRTTFDFLKLLLGEASNDFFGQVQLVGESYLFHGEKFKK